MQSSSMKGNGAALKSYKPQKFGTLHRTCMVKSAGVPKLYTRQISHTFSMESTKILRLITF